MKRYIGMLAVIFMISCSPDQKLARENEELLAITKELTQVAEVQKAEAERAMAMAMEAQSEAERAQKMAQTSAEEAVRQAELARVAQVEAEQQLSTRLRDVAELKKKLEKCN